MSQDDVSGGTPYVIDLGDAVDITTVKPLWQQFTGALAKKCDVALKGGAVVQVDTAGAQLISAFIQDAKAESVDVSWLDISESLQKAAHLLNLSGHMALPNTAPINK